VDLPTAVLLNIRNREAREAVQDGLLRLDLLFSATALGSTLYVVDGQHRILALEKLVEENPEVWGVFMVPFVCMLGAREEEEMRQFHIVNSTAKSVRTDLALQLLRQRAEKDPDVLVALQERGREWQVEAQNLVERLATESPIWKHRIRLANMEKSETTIPAASMAMSLKPLLQSPYFGALRHDDQLKVLEAYWAGMREILRPVFDEPTEYALQKGVGVMVMHSVLPHVLELVKGQGLSVTDAQSYTRLLREPLETLEGDDGSGSPVSGATFWAAAPRGAAGTYSGSAGRRVLAAKVRQNLPQVELIA
jgi:DGQHR domain-containing protein